MEQTAGSIHQNSGATWECPSADSSKARRPALLVISIFALQRQDSTGRRAVQAQYKDAPTLHCTALLSTLFANTPCLSISRSPSTPLRYVTSCVAFLLHFSDHRENPVLSIHPSSAHCTRGGEAQGQPVCNRPPSWIQAHLVCGESEPFRFGESAHALPILTQLSISALPRP